MFSHLVITCLPSFSHPLTHRRTPDASLPIHPLCRAYYTLITYLASFYIVHAFTFLYYTLISYLASTYSTRSLLYTRMFFVFCSFCTIYLICCPTRCNLSLSSTRLRVFQVILTLHLFNSCGTGVHF